MRDSTLMEFGRSTGKETTDAAVLRSGSNGRFMPDPAQPVEGSDGFRKSSNGRFVGNEVRDPGVQRGPDGRFREFTGSNGSSSGGSARGRDAQRDTGLSFGGGGSSTVGTSADGLFSADHPDRTIEFGGEEVDLAQRDAEELEQMNDFLSRNVDAEVDAERAKGGFGTSDLAQDMSSRQVEVAAELDRRRR